MLVYDCAQTNLAGQSMMTSVEKNGRAHVMPMLIDFDEDSVCVYRDLRIQLL